MACSSGIKFLLLVGFLLLYCEFLVYYVVLLGCSWPQLETQEVPLKIMLLADTHLLGSRNGHWFDKLRREWQMHRTFQTAMTLHSPDAVFVLGDLFDEGLWCSEEEFDYYVKRFHSLFYVPEKTKLFVIVGNHDIGFHYRVSKGLKMRFEGAFNTTPLELVSIRGNHFVLLNSMAMEGDGCFLCADAEDKLHRVAQSLACSQGIGENCPPELLNAVPYSKPFVLQHFPMYRQSDAICREPDSAPLLQLTEPFREKWECLSKSATDILMTTLKPRAVFSGHTHHGCYLVHTNDVPEWTLPSFSWRNKKNPSFILASVTPSNFTVNKCYMPEETTVFWIYCFGSACIFLWIVFTKRKLAYRRLKDNR